MLICGGVCICTCVSVCVCVCVYGVLPYGHEGRGDDETTSKGVSVCFYAYRERIHNIFPSTSEMSLW